MKRIYELFNDKMAEIWAISIAILAGAGGDTDGKIAAEILYISLFDRINRVKNHLWIIPRIFRTRIEEMNSILACGFLKRDIFKGEGIEISLSEVAAIEQILPIVEGLMNDSEK